MRTDDVPETIAAPRVPAAWNPAIVTAEELARIHRHRAVQEHRDIPQAPGILQAAEPVQKALSAADRESGCDHCSAPGDRARHDFLQGSARIDPVVHSVAIGGFHDEVIGLHDRCRIVEDGIIVSAEVSGEDD